MEDHEAWADGSEVQVLHAILSFDHLQQKKEMGPANVILAAPFVYAVRALSSTDHHPLNMSAPAMPLKIQNHSSGLVLPCTLKRMSKCWRFTRYTAAAAGIAGQ